jgi:hypothetical protein
MKSHLTGARSARPATVFSLLAAITAAVIALLPHVLATAAPATERTAASSYGIWSDSTVPAVPSSDETRSVTLGLVFSSATAGRLRAVQYYAAGANRVATTGDVWNGAGRRIASVRFPATATDGWKTASLSSSVRIRAGQKYTVSYRAPRGRNAVETGVFDDGGTLSARELTAHRGTFGYGTGRPTETTRGAHYFIDVIFAPSSTTSVPAPSPTPTTTSSPTPTPTPTTTSSPTPTPTPTPTPSPTPTPTTSPTPTPSPAPDPESGGVPTPADFPTPTSVGPATAPTVAYAGDCFFSAAESNLVVENRIVDCASTGITFDRAATGIVFRNSIIKGQMLTVGNTPGDPAADETRAPVFTVEDSRIIQSSTAGAQDRAACCAHFVIRRSLIQGTHSGLAAHNNVTLVGNYITTDGTDSHSSGVRILKNTVLRGNTIQCKPVTAGSDGGCSAHAVFYRERLDGTAAAAFNLTIEGNYFKRGTTAGGAAGGPWFATRFVDCRSYDDCVNIRFTGNLFDRGQGTDGGEFPAYGGNVWSDNWWTDGVSATSGQSR